MKLKLHHVDFCSTRVAEMDAFYRSVLGLETEPSLQASRVTQEGYAGKVAFFHDPEGNVVEVHEDRSGKVE